MILTLEKDSPDRELLFELDYLLSLSTRDRFRMMIQKSNDIKKMLIRNGHRKPSEIIKR